MPVPPDIMQVVRPGLGFVIMGIVPGYVLTRRCLPGGVVSDRPPLEAVERCFLVVATSVGVTSIVSLALAQLGRFSLGSLIVLLLTGSVLVAVLGGRSGSGGRSGAGSAPEATLGGRGGAGRVPEATLGGRGGAGRVPEATLGGGLGGLGGVAGGRRSGPGSLRPWGLPAILLLVAVALFTPPYRTALWGDDATVYVGFGTAISTTGAFLADDELVQSMPMAAREELFRNRTLKDTTGTYARFPGGIAIPDLQKGRTTAGFSPLFPVWVAVFHQLVGLPLLYYVAPFFGLLGIASVFFAGRALGGDGGRTSGDDGGRTSGDDGGRALGGEATGFVAALLLALCLPQVWFSRLPMSEGLAQFLVFSGLWALCRYFDTGTRYLAAVAGLLLGAAILARLDLLPILLLALMLFVAMSPPEHLQGAGARAFSSVFAIMLLYALAHLAFFPSNYGSLIGARLERLPLGNALVSIAAITPAALMVALLAGFGAATIVGLRLLLRRYSADPAIRRQITRRTLWAGITLYALAYLVSSRPRWTETVPWLAAYLSWPLLVAFAASAAGLTMGAARSRDPKTLLLLTLLAAAALHYLHNPQVIGDHIWVMRRFVPIVLPAIFLVIAAGLAALAHRAGRAMGAATALGLACAMALLVARPTLAVRGTPYWSDAARAADSLAASFPGDAVVLVTPELAGTHLQMTLTYQYGVDAILLQQRYPDPSILHGQVTDWLRAGRAVYLVGAAADFHFYAPDITLADPLVRDIDFLVLETTDSPPPRKPARRNARITALRARLRTGTPKTSVNVGDYADDALFVLRGVHEPEVAGAAGSGSFRWTGSEASIEIPAAASISLVVGGGRPAGVAPAQVSVWIDDEPVLEDRTVPDERTRITVANPHPSRSGLVTVRLRSNVFNPRSAGLSEDGRDLGVRLYRVEFGG